MAATTFKNHHGPTSIELSKILQDMQDMEKSRSSNSQHFKYDQKESTATKRPNLAKLSARDIEHIDGV